MSDATFEDWINQATWQVNLEITNDQKLLAKCKECFDLEGHVAPAIVQVIHNKYLNISDEVIAASKEAGIVFADVAKELDTHFTEQLRHIAMDKKDDVIPIDTDAHTIISKSIITPIADTGDYLLTFTHGKLKRDEYVTVDKVLKNMQGKWKRAYKGHVFSNDPSDKIEHYLLTGKVEKPPKYGEFFTQPELADKVVKLAKLIPGEMVLEPSAGHAALAWPIAKIVGIGNVKCIEIQEKHVKWLRKEEFMCRHADFLEVKGKPVFPKIVMNPPFEKQADIDHVLHAYNNFLKPGGKLVAIMSASIKWRENKKTIAFRELIESVNGDIIDNPEGSFKVSGTMVNTIIVVMDKPE